MSRDTLRRREFIGAALTAPLLVSTASGSAAAKSIARISPPAEPGKRLVISGTVFMPDGTTPARDATLAAYHTDSAGWYSQPENDPRRARLRGSLTTDANGAYRIETIVPGAYANMTNPPVRHIHVHLGAPNLPVHWIESYLFADDPRVTRADLEKAAAQGAFAHIMNLKAQNGILTGRRDIRIDPAIAEANQLVNGWYRR